MTTPNKEAILELAEKLYFKDNPDAPTPEEHELVESGYCYEAQNQLMRNDTSFESYLEEQAAQNGYRLVTEEEHSKLIELESAKEQAKKDRQKTKKLEEELERIRYEKQKKETKPQETLPFDLQETLATGIFTSGTSGSGKSDIGMYAASLLVKHDVAVLVFDSSQDWLNRSSISHYHTLANSFLDKIPEHSIIYDISHLTIRQQQGLVERFCRMLMQYQAAIPAQKRRQYFLIFEEAHTYFPEGCMRAKRFQNTVKMMTQGRNFKVRFMAITQFSSLIDKTAMRYMTQRFLGNSNEPNDVGYLRKIIGKYAEQLGSLKNGEFLYYNRGNVKRIQIRPFESTRQPIQIKISQSLPQQLIKKKAQHTHDNNGKTIASLIIALMWFIAIVIASSQRV